ncbi:MAG: hypothetical protein D6690_14730 [Nitrospirae bacterium]|nr:MAG: hypothetical protein D6690_14730 [Nitrospirota bacterium]
MSLAPSDHFPPITIEGFSAHLLASAVDPADHTLVMLALCGRISHLEAMSACLAIQSTFSLPGIDGVRWPGNTVRPLITLRQRLDHPGFGTLLLLPHRASPTLMRLHEPAYLIIPPIDPECALSDPLTPPSRFFTILNQIVETPLHASWAPALWLWGLEAGWIRPLLTHRLRAWELAPDDEHLRDWIGERLRARLLPVPSAITDGVAA